MRRIGILVTLVLALLLPGPSRAAKGEKLVVYTSMKESMIGKLRDAFVARHPEVEFDSYSAGAGKIMAKMGQGSVQVVDDTASGRGTPESATGPAAPLPEGGRRERATLACRPSEVDFVAEGGVPGGVSREAFWGEVVDYWVSVGGISVRVQKHRRDGLLAEQAPCRLAFAKPWWYD